MRKYFQLHIYLVLCLSLSLDTNAMLYTWEKKSFWEVGHHPSLSLSLPLSAFSLLSLSLLSFYGFGNAVTAVLYDVYVSQVGHGRRANRLMFVFSFLSCESGSDERRTE